MVRIFLATITFLLFLPVPAFAEDAPPPDKSGYTLFNPVPDDLMRGFATDRPGKSNTPTTVDAGHFQYESDIVNWGHDRYNAAGTTASSLAVIAPTFKDGLTNNTELEIAMAPINITNTTDRSSGTNNSAFGFGDVVTRAKFNLFGNEGGTYAMAIVPYVKLPSADQHIGNGHWEGGGYIPFSIALNSDWSVTFQTELDIQENAALDGKHTNYQNLVNLTGPIAGGVVGEFEFWSDVNTDRDSPTQYTLDLAALYPVTTNLQLDVGTNIGLNKAAPDIQLYTGISQRF